MLLLTVLLLSCLNVWSQTSSPISPSTGKQPDSLVTIPISFIREANAKLIEYNALKDINKEQETIIDLSNQLIKEQKTIISDFQSKVLSLNNANTSLNKQLKKERKVGNVFKSISIGTAIAAVLSFVIK